MNRFTALSACAIAGTAASAATADLVPYTFHLTLEHSSGLRVDMPVVTQWLETEFRPGVVNEENPLAVDQMEWVESAAQGDAPLTISTLDILRVRFDWDSISSSLHAEGIVHRDIAARNMIVETTGGTFSTDAADLFYFGNDGPPDLRAPGVGPVRWMAPESIRTKNYTAGSTGGSAAPGEYWELAAFSFFDASYVPAPSSLALVGFGALCVRRRR